MLPKQLGKIMNRGKTVLLRYFRNTEAGELKVLLRTVHSKPVDVLYGRHAGFPLEQLEEVTAADPKLPVVGLERQHVPA
ncbi:hypothetical protein D3C73_1587720 [compost metagenome]